MNNINKYLECQACKEKYIYITEINKHLDFCILYKEWLKNYIPPTGIKCENCNKIFVNEEYLNEHKNKC